MIRDPSDGSVKEISHDANEINAMVPKTPPKEITSGLPSDSTRPEQMAQLEKSREWLKQYHKRET